MFTYIYIYWGGFGGQCRHIFHTLSVWVLKTRYDRTHCETPTSAATAGQGGPPPVPGLTSRCPANSSGRGAGGGGA